MLSKDPKAIGVATLQVTNVQVLNCNWGNNRPLAGVTDCLVETPKEDCLRLQNKCDFFNVAENRFDEIRTASLNNFKKAIDNPNQVAENRFFELFQSKLCYLVPIEYRNQAQKS